MIYRFIPLSEEQKKGLMFRDNINPFVKTL